MKESWRGRAAGGRTLAAVINEYKRRRWPYIPSFPRLRRGREREREKEREIIYNPIMLGDINKAERGRRGDERRSSIHHPLHCMPQPRPFVPLSTYNCSGSERETVRELRDSPSSVTWVVRRPPVGDNGSELSEEKRRAPFQTAASVGKERQTRCDAIRARADKRRL